MCQEMVDNGRFDPQLCPLLQDLSPEQIAEAMAHNPQIRACAASFDAQETRGDKVLRMHPAPLNCREPLRASHTPGF